MSASATLDRETLRLVRERNPFYRQKFAGLPSDPAFAELPFTTKAELIADQAEHPPYGSNLTEPLANYRRLHQTSGTSSGVPLRWLDTDASWRSMLDCWDRIFAVAGVTAADRVFFPFSFGPFLGFWTAFEAACRMGALTLPAGGMSSTARLRFLMDQGATAVFCTPTYALHLAEVAAAEGVDLAHGPVGRLIVAGEPGGSIPVTRGRIEAAWGARLIDHYGLTEVGPVAVEPPGRTGCLCVLESHYIAEVLRPGTADPVAEREVGELVLTNPYRSATPLIRYRTGDLVRPTGRMETPVGPLLCLDGGILGRADDMLHVRGNNLYPSAIEAVVRRFPGVAEYRVTVDERKPLADLKIEVEPAVEKEGAALAAAVSRALRDELLFRAEVLACPPGALPRFEMKARRIVRLRPDA